MSRLRADLGDLIEIAHGGYRLATDANSLDSARFEQMLAQSTAAGPALAVDLLDRALRLCRGPAFGEFADLDAVRGAATRLESLILDARDAHASALWRVGRVADAAAAAGEIVAQHPLRESAWAVLIDAQARTSPGEALRTYRRAVAELAQVGLVPSDALRLAETRALLGTATHEPVRTTPGPGNRSRLIGRDDALVELGVLIQSNRLVTLVGPGGVGKTRLAKEIATRHRSDHPLGARVVSLGDVSEPAAVTAMIVEEVGFGGVDAAETELLARVGRLDMLVVIDNCEHVINAACSAIDAILDGGDAARIVATSRQRLGIDGERVWTTAPLGRHSDAVGDDFGVELFAERAASIGVDVTADLDAVSRIVERLDGLPLAIEMAAATLISQGLVDLETLTQSDPSVLRAPTRGAPDRQRTLANLIDWSLDDLDETTRRAAVDTAARQRHATYHLDRLIAHDAALRTADEADADRRICDAAERASPLGIGPSAVPDNPDVNGPLTNSKLSSAQRVGASSTSTVESPNRCRSWWVGVDQSLREARWGSGRPRRATGSD